MTQRKFFTDANSFGIKTQKSKQQHMLVGRPAEFYLWVDDGAKANASSWIRGDTALYYVLKTMHDKRQEERFQKTVEELHQKYPFCASCLRLSTDLVIFARTSPVRAFLYAPKPGMLPAQTLATPTLG